MGTEEKTTVVNKFESKLQRLDEIVKSMESGDLPLEQSLKLFEEGVKLSRECQSELDAAEQKVEILLNSEDLKTEAFKAKE